MKKNYIKPEVDYIEFYSEDTMADGDGITSKVNVDWVEGDWGE